MMNALGSGWRHGAAWLAITGFVTRVTTGGSHEFVPPEQRVAVFDDDGTLWCERPLSIACDFFVRRFAQDARRRPSPDGRQPWKAAAESDLAWFGSVMARHDNGDDTDLHLLTEAVRESFDGVEVGGYAEQAALFLSSATHPTLRRPYLHCAYAPMFGLMRYLEGHGFAVYVATGGDRDFARPLAARLYDMPPERVIGGTTGLRYLEDGSVHKDGVEFAGEAAAKPVRVWGEVGRRPILAVGNSNADIPLLRFTGERGLPGLRLLIDHDDAEREFAYADGAKDALAHADTEGWTVVSMREDWASVFGD